MSTPHPSLINMLLQEMISAASTSICMPCQHDAQDALSFPV